MIQGTIFDHKNKVTRLQPVYEHPGAYQTYEIDAPLATHWRQASCAEVDCPHHIHGWATTVLPDSDDESFMKRACESLGIKWTRFDVTPEGFRRYIFPGGQSCFKARTHRLPLEKPAIFKVWAGDWRGSDGTGRVFATPENWIDHFATHQDKLADLVNRG